MIYFDKVSKIYPGSPEAPVLDEVSFAVEQGEFVSVVGRSGAGKTTLLKLLIAEDRPTAGKIFFDSVDVHSVHRGELHSLRRRIGVVFQDFRLLPNKTAYENIAFAMEAAGKSDKDIAEDVPQVLELVNLSDKAWHFPDQISGGERQRVGIARAIVNQPDVVVADEPTGNLDPLNTWEIIQILRKINDLGTTVIMATHNKGVIDALGKRVLTLEKGRVVRDDREGRYIL